jgi:hypothetical protein
MDKLNAEVRMGTMSMASAVPLLGGAQTTLTYLGLAAAGVGALVLAIAFLLSKRRRRLALALGTAGLLIGFSGFTAAWYSHDLALPLFLSLDGSVANPPPRQEEIYARLNQPEMRSAICSDVGIPNLWERYARLELSEDRTKIVLLGEWIPYSMYDGHWYSRNILDPIERYAYLAAAESLERRSDPKDRVAVAYFLYRAGHRLSNERLNFPRLKEMKSRAFKRILDVETDPKVRAEILSLQTQSF